MIALPDQLFTSLETSGWAMSDEVIPVEWRHSLKEASQTLFEAGQFHDALIGQHASRQKNTDIRGDSICWVDPHLPPYATHPFFLFLADLRQTLNQTYFLGLRSEELHFARYGSGYGYKKHLDQHRNCPHRKISVVLYLNDDWGPDDGGELCLYEAGNAGLERVTRLLPTPGRFVMFRSDQIWHEVLPTRRTRWSLTGWFRDDQPITS